MVFGDAKPIKLSLMSDKEPKDALKPPFEAGSGLNALALREPLFSSYSSEPVSSSASAAESASGASATSVISSSS